MDIYLPSITSPVGDAQSACLPAGRLNVAVTHLIWVMQRVGLEGARGNHHDTKMAPATAMQLKHCRSESLISFAPSVNFSFLLRSESADDNPRTVLLKTPPPLLNEYSWHRQCYCVRQRYFCSTVSCCLVLQSEGKSLYCVCLCTEGLKGPAQGNGTIQDYWRPAVLSPLIKIRFLSVWAIPVVVNRAHLIKASHIVMFLHSVRAGCC